MQNYYQNQQNLPASGETVSSPLNQQAVQQIIEKGGQNGMQNYLPSQEQRQQQIESKKTFAKSSEVTEEMKKTYEQIFNAYGVETANSWLKQQILDKHNSLISDNEEVIKEIQAKYAQVYSIPAVQQAIQAYIDMDLDPSTSLRDQNFHNVVDHISNIYKAGYDAAMNLKNQNDFAKSRMTSAINSAVPHYQSNKVFSRAEIKSMSPEDFIKNEKTIFEQLNRGMIK